MPPIKAKKVSSSTSAKALSKKRPAAAASDEDPLDVADERSEGMLKRPAASGSDAAANMQLMKRPASANDAAEERSEGMLKRPAASGSDAAANMQLMKRPASANDAAEEQEEPQGEDTAEKAETNQNQAVEARAAARDVQRQHRLIDKLCAERNALVEKLKSNKNALRRAEQDMEGLREVAKRKAQSLGRIKSAKRKKLFEAKTQRAEKISAKAAAALKMAKKRMAGLKGPLTAAQDKAEDANMAMKREQRKYDEAKKRCAELKAKGEDVPEPGEKDLSAPGAWKPPGLQAAKDREAAKQSLAKVKAVWEKFAATAAVNEAKAAAIKDKMAEAKRKRQAAEEGSTEEAPAKVMKKPAGN